MEYEILLINGSCIFTCIPYKSIPCFIRVQSLFIVKLMFNYLYLMVEGFNLA
jgi:hypothetical protein